MTRLLPSLSSYWPVQSAGWNFAKPAIDRLVPKCSSAAQDCFVFMVFLYGVG